MYPISEYDSIVIDISEWNMGMRMFRYNSCRTESYFVHNGSKLEAEIQKTIEDVTEYIELMNERKKIVNRLKEIDNVTDKFVRADKILVNYL